jgi:flavin reductase (DIM6/NTAB) family NADH-FMN oxidoreductase RutF
MARKRRLPLSKVYQHIEPGPVVLVSSASGGNRDIMTMSWHTMIDFEPPIIGCVISNRKSYVSLGQENKRARH